MYCTIAQSFVGVVKMYPITTPDQPAEMFYSSEMTMLELLPAAIADVQKRLNLLTSDQLSLPTNCEGWVMSDLADHLVGGAKMSSVLMSGGTQEESMAFFAGGQLGDSAALTFATLAAQEVAAFQNAPSLDVEVPHPARPMPASQMLQFRVLDYLIHAWDLSRSLGTDETLNPEVVEAVWTAMQPMAAMIPHIGVFGSGASGTVSEDDPLQTRLLDLLGRRP